MSKIQNNLIYNIKFYRKKLKITQEKLAELCNVSSNYIGRIEIGYHFPSAEMFDKLSEALGIQPYMLFLNPDNLDNFTSNDIELKKQIIANNLIKEIEIIINNIVCNS